MTINGAWAQGTAAQTPTSAPRGRDALQNATVKRAQKHCQKISRQLRATTKQACQRGDRLDRRAGICLPPKGLYRPYSRWDPAAGRCKPRHRYDGGTCAGGKRRYSAGKHHAHGLAQSVKMYGKAPIRLAAANRQCRRGINELRRRVATERLVRQRLCSRARKAKDREQVNLYCK